MRDLLPPEASRRRRLARKLLDHIALHGYELVTPPAFELADVLERGLGALDPRDVLRFVEPESGEVAALRPDVTPQIARIAATRLADRPVPMRLCYEGTVLRRRQERARKHRQIPQTGVELLGVPGPEGDLELLRLAASSVRAAGLSDFVLDLGHADIARTMLGEYPSLQASTILEALAHKDTAVLTDLARASGVAGPIRDALLHLPSLHGGGEIWKEATRLLAPTPAAPSLAALHDLWERAVGAGLESVLRIDLGEVRGFAYYTGVIFHLFAEGPGEPMGSGGRYDDLLARFGAPMPAAGFALDLDNLSWALRACGNEDPLASRVLLDIGARGTSLSLSLRSRGVACVTALADPEAYARAWGYSHILRASRGDELVLYEMATSGSHSFSPTSDDDLAETLAEQLRSGEARGSGPSEATPPARSGSEGPARK